MNCRYLKYGLIWVMTVGGTVAASAQSAPSLTVTPQAEAARPGEPFVVTLEMAWSGGPDAWGILPPEVDAPAWGTVRRGAATLSQRGGENVYAQTLEFVAEASGDYETPVLTVAYESPRVLVEGFAEERMPEGTSAAGPMLREVSGGSVTVKVRKPFPFVPVGAFASVVLVLGVTAVAWRHYSTQQAEARRLARLAPVERAQTLLHDARRKRLDGDFYAFYQQLTAAVSVAGSQAEGKALAARLQERTREVGYKGIRPTEDDLDGDAKAAEAVIDQWKKEIPG